MLQFLIQKVGPTLTLPSLAAQGNSLGILYYTNAALDKKVLQTLKFTRAICVIRSDNYGVLGCNDSPEENAVPSFHGKQRKSVDTEYL